MGCGDSKVKLEDEIMKAKMARIEVQFERKQQMQILKDLDGTDYKPAIIPDYLSPTSIKKLPRTLRQKSSQSVSKFKKSKTMKTNPKRNKSSKIIINRVNTNSDIKTKSKNKSKKKNIYK